MLGKLLVRILNFLPFLCENESSLSLVSPGSEYAREIELPGFSLARRAKSSQEALLNLHLSSTSEEINDFPVLVRLKRYSMPELKSVKSLLVVSCSL